jgi:hypothetical protein
VVVGQALALLDAIGTALTHLVGNVQLQECCDDGLSPLDRRLKELLRAIRPPEATFDGSLGEVAASIEECNSYLRAASREIVFVLTTPTDLRHFGRLQIGASVDTACVGAGPRRRGERRDPSCSFSDSERAHRLIDFVTEAVSSAEYRQSTVHNGSDEQLHPGLI